MRPLSRLLALSQLVALGGLAATSAMPDRAEAQASAAATARAGLPAVPTTRVLAIGRMTAAATPAARREVMPAEVRDTVALYLGGKIDQWFVRQDLPGVVFVMNVGDVKEAHELLESLPLGRAGLMEFDLIPLGPLSPLSILAAPTPPGR